jgi:uncharacterized protein
MKIVLIGAAGAIGQRILTEALACGHQVTAVVRDDSRVADRWPNVEYVIGDIFDPQSVADAAVDHDVVVSAHGPGTADPSLLIKAAHSLIDALTRVEAIRRIVVGGAGTLEVKPGVQLVDAPEFPAQWRGMGLAHRDALDVCRFAEFDWTAITPPALIEPGTRTGHYRTGTDMVAPG